MKRAFIIAALVASLASCATIPDVFALREGASIEALRSSSVRPLRVEHWRASGHAMERWTYAKASFTFEDGALVEWSGQ